MRAFLLAAISILCVSCNNYQYNTQICSASRRVDVPVFDGTYKIIKQDGDTFETSEVPYVLKHVGTGTYESTDENGKVVTVNTCKIGTKTVVEEVVSYIDDADASQSPKSGYALQELVFHGDDFLMVSYYFDAKTLNALATPFNLADEVIACGDDPDNDPDPAHCNNKMTTKYMVIDNTQVTPEKFIEAAAPMPVVYRFVKQ